MNHALKSISKYKTHVERILSYLNQELRFCQPGKLALMTVKIYLGVALFITVYSPFTSSLTFNAYSIGLKWLGVFIVFTTFYGVYLIFYLTGKKLLKRYHGLLIILFSALAAGALIHLLEAAMNLNTVISFTGVLDNSLKISLILFLLLVFLFVQNKRVVSRTSNLSTQVIVLSSKNKKETLSLETEDILMIASHENYIKVYFMKDEKLRTTLLRNTITYASQRMQNPDILRCHRKYIVNLSRVYAIVDKNQKLNLRIDGIEGEITVSKPYVKTIKERVAQKSVA